jgi:hypothetical protein
MIISSLSLAGVVHAGQHAEDYLLVYVSKRLLASRAALRQLFLGHDDQLPQALDYQIRQLLPRRFVNQLLQRLHPKEAPHTMHAILFLHCRIV